MNEERIKELFSNEEFVKDLFESESFEEAQKKLADKDVEVSVEELKKAYELIQKKQNGEISDEDLEEVAGGLGFATIFVSSVLLVEAGLIAYGLTKSIKKAKKSGC